MPLGKQHLLKIKTTIKYGATSFELNSLKLRERRNCGKNSTSSF